MFEYSKLTTFYILDVARSKGTNVHPQLFIV